MADAVVGFLLESLSRILSQEVNLLLGLKGEIQLLEDDLKRIHLYLKGFDGRDKEDSISKDYVNQIRDLVHEAEDVIDDYYVRSFNERDSIWRKAMVALKFPIWAATAQEITSIRSRVNGVYERREDFVAAVPEQEQPRQGGWRWGEIMHVLSRRIDPSEEVDMVGFENEVDTMISHVKASGLARVEVISVVGMSGSGKTTLASRVYNDPAVESHFPVRAWVTVSQNSSPRSFLEAITKEITKLPMESVRTMSDDELTLESKGHLRSSRFLIVLDDVWQPELWKGVGKLVSGNKLGSRIILTTQLNDLAWDIPNNTTLSVRFLSEEESWQLLSKRVFKARQGHPQLQKLGFEIARKCRGLPLSIIVIAGVLAKQESTTWWSQVSSSVSEYIHDQNEQCQKILELSYKHLPFHLRQCFLYFGLFPEDYEIPVRLLIRLWIAEGFIPKKDTITEEELAEEYLSNLIARNLVQVSKRRSDGRVKSCFIHDLLRVFCISKAKSERYLEIRGYANSSSMCVSRRLTLHDKALHYINSNPSSKLRTLFIFGRDDEHVEARHWKYLYKGYKLLRVLGFLGGAVDNIPSEIDKLICLRYLRFKSDSSQALPPSISNLWNLQTLEIIAPLDRPEIKVWGMRQLRHFYFKGGVVIPQPPKKMMKDEHDYLSQLQSLLSIDPDSCTEVILNEMPNLVTLGIFGDLNKLKDPALKRLSRLVRLRKLKLTRDLRYDNLNKLPTLEVLTNIKILTLSRTGLSKDPMDQLQKLPNLQVLKLKHSAFTGRRLECQKGRFPQLEVLKLIDLSIREWEVSAAVMPSLISVSIGSCGSLVHLPCTLADISTLQELQLSWISASVVKLAGEIKALKEQKQESFRLRVINHADNTN